VLKTTRYRDYLIRHCGCNDEVANCFQGRTLDFFGLGRDAVAAADARDFGYPGFDGLGMPVIAHPEPSEHYIYHFPDGNASLARLLVRCLCASRHRPGRMRGPRIAGTVGWGKSPPNLHTFPFLAAQDRTRPYMLPSRRPHDVATLIQLWRKASKAAESSLRRTAAGLN
jgi:hypothetical protein